MTTPAELLEHDGLQINFLRAIFSIEAAEGEQIRISKACEVTGKEYFLILSAEAVCAWLDGELIQRVFPELSDSDREFLISGISPEGQKLQEENYARLEAEYAEQVVEHDDFENPER